MFSPISMMLWEIFTLEIIATAFSVCDRISVQNPLKKWSFLFGCDQKYVQLIHSALILSASETFIYHQQFCRFNYAWRVQINKIYIKEFHICAVELDSKRLSSIMTVEAVKIINQEKFFPFKCETHRDREKEREKMKKETRNYDESAQQSKKLRYA